MDGEPVRCGHGTGAISLAEPVGTYHLYVAIYCDVVSLALSTSTIVPLRPRRLSSTGGAFIILRDALAAIARHTCRPVARIYQ